MLELHFDDFTAMTKAPDAQLFLPIMQRRPKAWLFELVLDRWLLARALRN
jgi:hypothetical protein